MGGAIQSLNCTPIKLEETEQMSVLVIVRSLLLRPREEELCRCVPETSRPVFSSPSRQKKWHSSSKRTNHCSFVRLPNWAKCLRILMTFNPRRPVLLITQGIFLIPRSDKGLQSQSRPVMAPTNCDAVPLFDLSDTYRRLQASVGSPPKIISDTPNDFDATWWCLDQLTGAPFVHHLQTWDSACVGKISLELSWLEISLKSQIILIRVFSALRLQTRGSVDTFFPGVNSRKY